MLPSGVWNTACEANRLSPNGGAYMPMLRLTAMMMPKWIGSTPTACTSGSSSGVRIRIAAGGSRKLPMMSRMTLIDSSSAQAGMCSALTSATIACGMPLVVSSQE